MESIIHERATTRVAVEQDNDLLRVLLRLQKDKGDAIRSHKWDHKHRYFGKTSNFINVTLIIPYPHTAATDLYFYFSDLICDKFNHLTMVNAGYFLLWW
jgi:hypothetical protein